MKKNGFTLVELLVVIALIGSLSTVVGVSVSSMLNRQKEKNYIQYKKELEEAACTLVELLTYQDKVITSDNKTLKTCRASKNCEISTNYLIQEGFIDEELENPKSSTMLKNEKNPHKIIVTWIDGEKKCTYQE